VSQNPLFRCALLSLLIWIGTEAAPAQGSRRLDQQFQSAASLYDAGHYPEAAAQLEGLLRHLPTNFDIHELLGLVYSAESQDAKAAEHLEKAVRLKPGSVEARINLATNLVHTGKLVPAESQFKRAIELDPNHYGANHDLGELYVRLGRLNQAVKFLDKAQQLDASSYDNGYDLSLAYLLTGRTTEARETVRNLLKLKNAAELHNLLGNVEESAGNFVPAANEFETAAHMDPSESNLFDWASELLLHRTLDPAVEVFQHAVERYPASPRLTIGLGMALYSHGNYDDAVKFLLKGADLSPSDARCYLFLSKAYDSSPSQAADVIKRFQRFAEVQPQNARAHYYYAMSLWKGKRAQDAGLDVQQIELLLKKSLALDPNFAEAHLQLGNLFSEQNKYADSIPEYLKAIERNSDLADAHYRLAQAYVHTGQKESAQQQFQVYQQLRAQHLADLDKQKAEIRQFVYSAKDGPLHQSENKAVAQ
jgi:tetratricopeptide (TPR) repeat protein